MSSKNETKAVKPFGFKDKLGYMFGDFGNDFTFMLSSMYLLKFYTDVMAVPSWIVGLLMMLARFVDAVTDVIMGQICDRSKVTATGKFRPWIRRMMGPVAVASFLIYASWFKEMPMTFKVVWMFLTYLLWGSVFYTGINIPYGSMASAITSDPKERQSLSTARTIGGSLAGVMMGVILPVIVYYKDASGNTVLSDSRMVLASLICSIGALITYALCYFMTTERVKMDTTHEKFTFSTFIKTTFSSKAMVGIILAALMLLLAQLTQSSMTNYVYPNYFQDAKAISLSGMLSVAVMLGISPFIGKLANKFGRKEVAIFGSLFGAAAMIACYFMHTKNVYIFMMLSVLSQVGIACFNLVIWAMITDVIDDFEIKTGERSDGAIYSVYSFARKLGQAASAGLTGVLLTAIGYTTATAFDANVTLGIYNVYCIVPAIGFIALALILKFVYPLGKKEVAENAAILATKKEKAAV
jgi:GPH family glycoside/pentoside/hexuronide:cation symporter